MKTQFTPIAMRCTEEQFKAIEPKLIKGGCDIKMNIGNFEEFPNLCNNANGVEKRINNYSEINLSNDRKYYNAWDEATFLKSCGIEVTPTLEEVKEYFKNAKEVRCLSDLNVYNISGLEIKKGVTCYDTFFIKDKKGFAVCELYCKTKGYAEIISYKDTYTVSKDFILQSHKDACSTWKAKIENQFPELFPKVKMEVGKWYKHNQFGSDYLINYQGNGGGYGFFNGAYSIDWSFGEQRINQGAELATKEEVETALSNEFFSKAKVGDTVKCLNGIAVDIEGTITEFEESTNTLLLSDTCQRFELFKDGKFAEIISEPIELTLEQIAEKFGVEVEQIKIKK